MNLMHNPNKRVFFCWFELCETIEDGWQCEAGNAQEAAELYWEHVGLFESVIVCVGSSTAHERWKVSRSGDAEMAA